MPRFGATSKKSGTTAIAGAKWSDNDAPVASSRQEKCLGTAEEEADRCHDVSQIDGRMVMLSIVSIVIICPL
jgi:hypothetical protein